MASAFALTDHTPKPLLPIGGKPMIVHHLEKIADSGIKEVVINLGPWFENTPVSGQWFYGGYQLNIRMKDLIKLVLMSSSSPGV